ncbi:MAG: replication initiation protein [Acutalibacteraceae bacterium]|nr:replication initiation protein [Acutalibacteraceae bacterium]
MGRKSKDLCLHSNLKCSNVVQKSKPLFELWKSNLSLCEFKILDIYLSRINSHDSSKRSVQFSKNELQDILNVTKITRHSLDERLKHLQSTTVDISTDNKTIHRITLFEESYAQQDDDGFWTVTLTCTEKAVQYIFNIERFGYLRYKLQSVINLSSLYSYVLFMFLEYNRNFYKATVEIALDELKSLLNCTDDTYNEYKYFNNLVLKRCHKEITEKTDLKFSYESFRRGRKVSKIRFNIETIKDNQKYLSVDADESVDVVPAEQQEHTYLDNSLYFLADACKYEFSEDEIRVLRDILAQHNDKVLACSKTNFDDVSLARYDYLFSKYNEFKLVKNVKNRFSYFKKMIENDLS